MQNTKSSFHLPGRIFWMAEISDFMEILPNQQQRARYLVSFRLWPNLWTKFIRVDTKVENFQRISKRKIFVKLSYSWVFILFFDDFFFSLIKN